MNNISFFNEAKNYVKTSEMNELEWNDKVATEGIICYSTAADRMFGDIPLVEYKVAIDRYTNTYKAHISSDGFFFSLSSCSGFKTIDEAKEYCSEFRNKEWRKSLIEIMTCLFEDF